MKHCIKNIFFTILCVLFAGCCAFALHVNLGTSVVLAETPTFKGEGTKEDPYLLNSVDDIESLIELEDTKGLFFDFAKNDIVLEEFIFLEVGLHPFEGNILLDRKSVV